jgi:uncharacterized protein (DUF427 family)
MTLTFGRAPLAAKPATTNFQIDGPAHRLLFEPHPRRIRAELGGRIVLDTTRASLLYETALLPVIYAPIEDLDASLLERTDHHTTCPFKGEASYWTVRAGDRVAENAVWGYEDPLPGAEWLTGHVALYADRMDRWLEEDEELVQGHVRDPYHRVDVRRSSRPVEVSAGEQTLLHTDAPLLLFETGLPPRAYLTPDAFDLVPSEKRTFCPYKGEATYWSLRVGDRVLEDAAWSYETPIDGVTPIAGLVSLHHEELEVRIG